MFLLDSNICIYALKGRYPALKSRLGAHAPTDMGIPSIVKAELLLGAEKSQSRDKTLGILEAFLAPFAILPFGDSESIHYARIRAQTEAEGRPIGPNDLLIAATAMAVGGVLITHNLREFSAVRGLVVEDWTGDA